MGEGVEYRLSKAQQRAAMALAQARDRAQAEFQEIMEAFDALAAAYAATFGEERRVRFDQEGERIFLIVVPEEPEADVPAGNAEEEDA